MVISSARKILEQRSREKPVFLWIHLYPPHSPYATPAPFVGMFDPSNRHRTRFDSTPPWFYSASVDRAFPAEYVGRYDESIAYVDSHIGRLITWLKSSNMYDDALIIVTADHGESFSHGYGDHSGPALYEDLIHVPLIIKEPQQQAGRRLTVLSEQIDLKPTILEYAGGQVLHDGEGVTIKHDLKMDLTDRQVFSMNFQQNNCFGELGTGTVAMLYGDWKYVHYLGNIQLPLMPKLMDSLYNLRSDPDESINLAGLNPEIAARMLWIIEQKLNKYDMIVK